MWLKWKDGTQTVRWHSYGRSVCQRFKFKNAGENFDDEIKKVTCKVIDWK